MNDLTLSQLICTRISHDLSGAMGAVYNGTELLQEDDGFVQETASLLQNSAKDLMARMRFFRQTFGLPKETEDTTNEYLKTFSIPFELKGECTDNLQRALIMTLTDYFYKGATFDVTLNTVTAGGVALKDCSGLFDLLQLGQGDEIAANAAAFFAYQLCRDDQKTMKIFLEEEKKQIVIRVE